MENNSLIIPIIKDNDTVVFDNDKSVTINGKKYTGILIETNDSSLSTNTIMLQGIATYFTLRSKTFIAFDNHLLSNPNRSLSEMTMTYQGRNATFNYVPVFFQLTPIDLKVKKEELKFNVSCFYTEDKVSVSLKSGMKLDKDLFINDPGHINKFAYLYYGEANEPNIKKAKEFIDSLDAKVDPIVVDDTYITEKNKERDEFMKKKLEEWGVSTEGLNEDQLEDLYEKERQRRSTPINVTNTKKETIKPYDFNKLEAPVITQKDLPETGFRKYAPKIMLFTALAIGTTFYMKFKNRGQQIENE